MSGIGATLLGFVLGVLTAGVAGRLYGRWVLRRFGVHEGMTSEQLMKRAQEMLREREQ